MDSINGVNLQFVELERRQFIHLTNDEEALEEHWTFWSYESLCQSIQSNTFKVVMISFTIRESCTNRISRVTRITV
jgi:hypothetical protein